MTHENAIEEVKYLAVYFEGMGDATNNERFKKASDWLDQLADHICGQGVWECSGGKDCGSDHK